MIEKFLRKIGNIQKDKLLHFFWGAILSFILILFFGKDRNNYALLLFQLLKNYIMTNILGRGCCEWADYFYTIAPTIMLVIMKY